LGTHYDPRVIPLQGTWGGWILTMNLVKGAGDTVKFAVRGTRGVIEGFSPLFFFLVFVDGSMYCCKVIVWVFLKRGDGGAADQPGMREEGGTQGAFPRPNWDGNEW